MTNINILYDGHFDDVDIISVPSNIVECISNIAQEYLDWIPPESDSAGWVVIDNRKCMSKGAAGFVKWLNSSYCCGKKAGVVCQNVAFCPDYPTVEF